MADQPRYDPLQESAFFTDGLSARPLPDGVIARDFTEPNEALDFGEVDGEWVERIPMPVTMDLLRRGQERYNIFCVPCHDFTGGGRGMAFLRGFRTPPRSFHTDEMRAAPAGRFFDAMTNGFGAMSPYSHQLTPSDRWAVVAYIRALQMSQWSSIDEVPPEERQGLQ